MINGAYLKNETGPPIKNGPLLIGSIITRFWPKASQLSVLGIIKSQLDNI